MGEWISVKDRLPPREQRVLGIDQYGDQEVCNIDIPWSHETEPRWQKYEGAEFDPTHWMPLPESPNEMP